MAYLARMQDGTRFFFLSLSVSILMLAGLGYSPASLAAPGLSLTTGYDYSSGDYGDDIKTEISSVPFIAKYETERWTFKLTVPYVTIKGPGDVIPDIGQVNSQPVRRRTTESGLGDTVASATYSFYPTFAQGLILDVTGKIKFATADEDKGLGTGENDYAVQVDAYKGFGKFTAIAGVGYRVYGDPSFGTLDNVFYGSLGGAYRLSPATSAGVIYDYRPKITDTGSEISEALAFVSHKLSEQWKAQAYLVKGFSDGSPDYGGGLMLGYSF